MEPWDLNDANDAHLVAIDIVGFSRLIDDPQALAGQRHTLTSAVEDTVLFAKRREVIHWQFLGDELRIAIPLAEPADSVEKFIKQIRQNLENRVRVRVGWVTGELTPRVWLNCPYFDGMAAFRVQRLLELDSLHDGGIGVESGLYAQFAKPQVGATPWKDEPFDDDYVWTSPGAPAEIEPPQTRTASTHDSLDHHVVVAFREFHDAVDHDETSHRAFRALLRLLQQCVQDQRAAEAEDFRVSISPKGILVAFRDAHLDRLRRLIHDVCERAKRERIAIGTAAARGFLNEFRLFGGMHNFEGRAAIVASRIAAKLEAGTFAVDDETLHKWPEIETIVDHVLIPGKRDEEFPAHVAADYFDVTFLGVRRGIVKREVVQQSRGKLEGEVYVIELLEEPIVLERDVAGDVMVTIDRRDVHDCIITNRGKQEAFERYVRPNYDTLKAEDRKIHEFLLSDGVASKVVDPIALRTRLRWASGGVLSIVRFRGCEWVPLFFRDIKPYGWNISLGSAERRLPLQREEQEHRDPLDFMIREFCEESLVLNADPASGASLAFRPFGSDWVHGVLDDQRRRHMKKRMEADGLKASLDGRRISLTPHRLKRNMSLKIVSNIDGRTVEDGPTDDVLICFTLLDLGIEVVKVFRYELAHDDYMLDGELDFADASVRMPIVLFSCEYLRGVFSDPENALRYTDHEPPSIEVDRDPAEGDTYVFDWDIKQRMKIVNGEKRDQPHIHRRFEDWNTDFGPGFLSSRLFVPGTAKILNLFFAKS